MMTQWIDAPGGFHPASAPDFLPRRELERLQLGRLQAVVARAHENVPLFRHRMEERNLRPDSIRTLTDLAKLPFTVKTDLRDTYPFGLFASPMEEIVRLHASSGTTGKPIVVAYTEADLQVWTSVMVRTFAACGLHKGDVIQNAYGYGLFTGGLGAHYGGEALGATVIPISGGNTERQLMVLEDFNVTAICCTPSYMVHLIERAKEAKIGFGRLKVGVFGAEPWSESMRKHIEAEAGIKAYDIYGLSEIIGPGVGIECARQDGLHHPPHPPHRPPLGRHVHHPRRERLPVAGRGGAPRGRGDLAALPDRPLQGEGARRDGGAGRGHPRGLLRHDRRARGAPQEARERHRPRGGDPGEGAPRRAAHHRAQR